MLLVLPGKNEKKIYFVLTRNELQRFLQNMKAIAGEFQCSLMAVDIDIKKIRNAVRKICIEKNDKFAHR